ncbi:high mobility group protein Z [Photorhabdus laumondii subsp. laumondii]|nr:high mobility group protein Z [Photorhabdus laumondii subsp. laumondii]KTL60855.1 high mobility group protein Z [Photorhabdus laumondii subsp. laumondii]RAW71055.1 high mobility group protein Z [Photorhabdus sp. S7-51]RAW72473.1 high mobility group protein Z [Photorhabdus sp. S14-60]RAW77857.1 high mobility group protein Z [Photorhabdus sp. S15-56]
MIRGGLILITILIVCYLLWLLGKLWRLSRRKTRLRGATIAQHIKHMKVLRFDGQKHRKE